MGSTAEWLNMKHFKGREDKWVVGDEGRQKKSRSGGRDLKGRVDACKGED